jgi:predicted secreted protein
MRRHLTTGQRAMTAAALANISHGGDRKSDQETNSSFDKSTKDSADHLNVGTTAVKTAKAIKRDAPDLAEEVSKGNMTLNLVVRFTSVITTSTIGVCRSFLI